MAEDVDKNIFDVENVIRGVCTPYHIDKKKEKLKRAAFRQKIPTKGVSVYRTAILSSHSCKERAKALSGTDKQYVGLARVKAGAVRAANAKIEDTRETMFYGHADIFIMIDADGFVPEAGEPLPPEISAIVDERIDAILREAKFFLDSQPEADDWVGPDLAVA
jgi:hypothetical protein